MNYMRKLVFVFFVIVIIILAVMYWPVSIEGFWTSPLKAMGPVATFYLFQDGKMLHYIEHDKFIVWGANYEKIGWGKYRVDCHWSESSNIVVYSSMFNLRSNNKAFDIQRIRNDSIFVKIYNDKKLKWLTNPWQQDLLVVDKPNGTEYFFNGREMDLKQLSEQLDLNQRWAVNFTRPLNVYSCTNYIPHSMTKLLKNNDFDYVAHTNQHWVMDLEYPYVRVSKGEGSELKYSIKFKRD